MPADTVSAPVEIAIIEFPGSRFNGEIVPALTQLVDDGIVAIIDLVLVSKDVDGSVTVLEISELDDETAGAFDDLDGEAGGLLSEDDLAQAAEALSLGSSALMIVWQDTLGRRDSSRRSRRPGGRLVAHDRLDAETVAEVLAADAG